MKIVMISTLRERTPPPFYGGTERVVSDLTEGLVRKGHDVTLFATGDSITKAKLISVYPRPLYRDNVPWTSYYDTLINVTRAIEYALKIKADIIHSHVPILAVPFSKFIEIPLVVTMHSTLEKGKIPEDKKRAFLAFKDANYISISNSQRQIKELNYVATVYNGIPINQFSFGNVSEDYLVWLGRFNPSKGAAEAIAAAKASGKKLILAGKIDWAEKSDIDYFKKKVKPYLIKGRIEYIGEIDIKKRDNLLGRAKALISPINWDEPFGLVPMEANATGTPAIVFARGAMKEIMKNGINGYLVKPGSKEGLVEAIKKIYQMPEEEYGQMRINCRKYVEENFSVEKMVEGYLKTYKKLLR